ncbi:2-dehydro-3-deoxy-6-phosphogalactonate aldolase [Frateuria aurantia]
MKAHALHEVFLHGLLATVRGIQPEESADLATLLYRHDFRLLEVPLNTPGALASIRQMRERLPPDCLIGAGMVFHPEEIETAREAGAGLIISPHCDPALIRTAKQAGLACIASAATPTEAFQAIEAGTDAIRYFPAEQLGPISLKIWRSVLPKHMPLLPTGGITPGNMKAYLRAGAAGFGLGRSLYKPGMEPAELSRRAESFRQAWLQAHGEGWA